MGGLSVDVKKNEIDEMKESIKNVKKRREIWRNIILKNLLEENLQKKLLNEKRICLILDNFSVHKSAFIKKIAKILNIELINLPPYSPHLNPIEQLWRIMKNIIRNEYLKSKESFRADHQRIRSASAFEKTGNAEYGRSRLVFPRSVRVWRGDPM